MSNATTSFVSQLRSDFTNNPAGSRVVLPDGSTGIVRRFRETDQGRVYHVQGIDHRGRFRSLGDIPCWLSGDVLRLVYYSTSARASS